MSRNAAFVIRVAPEPEHDKPGLMPAVDEVVTGPLEGLHLERMDDGIYWLGLYGKRGASQRIVISAINPRAHIVARTESD